MTGFWHCWLVAAYGGPFARVKGSTNSPPRKGSSRSHGSMASRAPLNPCSFGAAANVTHVVPARVCSTALCILMQESDRANQTSIEPRNPSLTRCFMAHFVAAVCSDDGVSIKALGLRFDMVLQVIRNAGAFVWEAASDDSDMTDP